MLEAGLPGNHSGYSSLKVLVSHLTDPVCRPVVELLAWRYRAGWVTTDICSRSTTANHPGEHWYPD